MFRDKKDGLSKEDIKKEVNKMKYPSSGKLDIKAELNKRNLKDWIEAALKSNRYTVHISSVVEEVNEDGKKNLKLEHHNVHTHFSMDDLIEAARDYNEYTEAQFKLRVGGK